MGTAPITKNRIYKLCKSNTKGMKPIAKNIIVTDEQGNEYEATYPKRAKGLVKNGRARFVSDNIICLACPPNKFLEDIKMLNINIAPEDVAMRMTEEINKALEQNPTADVGEIVRETIEKQVEAETATEESPASSEKLSMNYVLGQIERIINDTQYLHEIIGKLGEMENANGPGDIVGQAKAEALSNVVKCRETTNQQLLRIYEKMYDDLKGINKNELSDEVLQFKQVCEIIKATQTDIAADATIRHIAQQMFVKPGTEIVKLA